LVALRILDATDVSETIDCSTDNLKAARKTYGRALSSLQRTLNDQDSMQTSFGSWHTLERDRADVNQGDEDASKEHKKIRFMRKWSRKKSDEMLQLWDGKQMSTDMFQCQLQVLEVWSPSGWKGRRMSHGR
jgi:hypothetical protein